MANQIRVSTEKLTGIAARLEAHNDDYYACFNNILRFTEDLASTWNGSAQQAYLNQVNGFRNDFQNLYNLLNQFCTYLRNTAAKYENTENEIIQRVGSISTGI